MFNSIKIYFRRLFKCKPTCKIGSLIDEGLIQLDAVPTSVNDDGDIRFSIKWTLHPSVENHIKYLKTGDKLYFMYNDGSCKTLIDRRFFAPELRIKYGLK